MNLEGVAQILQAAGVGVPGQTIFVNFMPADKKGMLLRQGFGGTPIDPELPGYRKSSFMLIVRDKQYQAGKALIDAAMASLTLEDVSAGGMKINYMRPRNEAFVYQPSPGSNIEFTTNIDCSYVIL